MDKENRNDLRHLSEAFQRLCFSGVDLGVVSGSILDVAFLGSQFVVPLHKFVIVSGPMGDGIVHLEYACVAGLEDRHEALHHLAPESFAVHPFAKVKLLRGDLAT